MSTFAFVALDIKTIAYLPSPAVTCADGSIKTIQEFSVTASKKINHAGDSLRGKSIHSFPLFPIHEHSLVEQQTYAPVRQFLENARTYVLINPDKEQIITKSLAAFCRQNDLSVSGLLNVASGLTTNYKGWGCQRMFNKSELIHATV